MVYLSLKGLAAKGAKKVQRIINMAVVGLLVVIIGFAVGLISVQHIVASACIVHY